MKIVNLHMDKHFGISRMGAILPKKLNFSLAAILLVFGGLAGCIPEQKPVAPEVPPSSEVVQFQPITGTALPAPTETRPLATETPMSTATPLPPSRTPTPLPTSTSTPTPVPTLTIEEEDNLVRQLMETNGGCQLPCWWGIAFGTTVESVKQQLEIMGIGINGWDEEKLDVGNRGCTSLGYLLQGDPYYQVDIYVCAQEVAGAVQSIEISAHRPVDEISKQNFWADWQPYFLGSILEEHGQPDYVEIILSNPAEPVPPVYILRLSYPEQGLQIAYTIPAVFVELGVAKVCLGYENVTQIDMSLYQPAYEDQLPQYLIANQLETHEENSWENKVGMDLASFYGEYKGSDNPGCVQFRR